MLWECMLIFVMFLKWILKGLNDERFVLEVRLGCVCFGYICIFGDVYLLLMFGLWMVLSCCVGEGVFGFVMFSWLGFVIVGNSWE